MKNIDIRLMVSESGVHYTDIAKKMGIGRVWLSKLMSQTARGELHDFSVGNAYIHTEKRAVISSETRATFSQISDHVREKMETVPSENRWIYNFAYGLHAEGRLTDDQLFEVIEHYDQGDFDFTPTGWSAKTDH